VEDSRTQRHALSRYLERQPGLELVGLAEDGVAGVAEVQRVRPDVVLMDVRMPRLDGLAATQQIMATCPTPILLMTAPDNLSSDVSLGLRALEKGALDLIAKPNLASLERDGPALASRLKLLAGVPVISHVSGHRESRLESPSTGYFRRAQQAVGVVASTGGPNALRVVLASLQPQLRAAVVIVQHIDAAFMEGLVRWLDEECPLPVLLAEDGQELRERCVYVCPSGLYAEVTDRRRLALLAEDVPPGGHCPSGDRLLESVATAYGRDAAGVVLTGMGTDGAAGLLAIRDAGGRTFAQDEATSVIYGMPRAAKENGAAAHILALEEIGPAVSLVTRR
jgi:two-component system chemotaxis response regulator CheB